MNKVILKIKSFFTFRNIKIFLEVFLILFIFYTFSPIILSNSNSNLSNTIIYDRNGKLLYQVLKDNGGLQKNITINEINKNAIKTIIFSEDHDFYSHKGISIKSKIRALITNIKYNNKHQGGSTITEQWLKNKYFINNNRSYLQKMREAFLAVSISLFKDKNQILEEYLNNIYFGNLAYGIESASNLYFKKTAKDLTLSESVFLASMISAPSFYDPYKNFALVKSKQEILLKNMLNEKYISQEIYLEAINFNIILNKKHHKLMAPHFIDYITRQLQKIIPDYKQGGYKIYTSLDLDWQIQAESIINNKLLYLNNNNVNNGALLAINPINGEVLTMVGSKNYFDNNIMVP